MVGGKYIDAKNFNEFCSNQKELIDILNHRMTQVEKHMASIKIDLDWVKKILWLIFGGIMATLITLIIKTVFGM